MRKLLALVVTLVVGSSIVAGCGTSDSDTETTESTPAQTTQQKAPKRFGPVGYGSVTIGMTKDETLDTGDVAELPGNDEGECVSFDFSPLVAGEGESPTGLIGPSGVEHLEATRGVKTPEGIGLGSSEGDLRAAYGNKLVEDPIDPAATGLYMAHVEGQPSDVSYHFLITDGKVEILNISRDTPRCYY